MLLISAVFGICVALNEYYNLGKVIATSTIWYYGVVVSTLGWLFMWISVILQIGVTNAHIIVVLGSFLLLPLAVAFDCRQSGMLEELKWESVAYIVFSFVPMLAIVPGAAYLYRREKAL